MYWWWYPNFFNIISASITLLSTNPTALTPLSALISKVLIILNANADLSEDEVIDLLQELIDCLLALQKLGVLLSLEGLKKHTFKLRNNPKK